MRALVQRVSRAAVSVDGRTVGRIERGLLVLLGVRAGDTPVEADWLADKVVGLRIFPDAEGRGRFDRGVAEIGGGVLVVSQFTLYGETRKGRRPNFGAAAAPEVAEALYERFCAAVANRGLQVERGVFGAMMDVELVNDGPVTLMIEREAAGIASGADTA